MTGFSYAEGITYVIRSSLKTDYFNPTYDASFYGKAMIEVVYNKPLGPNEGTHPRSKVVTLTGNNGGKYKCWDAMYIGYGPSPTQIKRMHKIHSHKSGDVFWASEASKDNKVGICPVPLPTQEEKYMWIDNTFPVRSVMFPLAKATDSTYQHVAAYVHMGFNWRYTGASKKTKIWTNDGSTRTVGEYEQDLAYGWNYLGKTYRTMRIDCRAAYLCLSVDHNDREPTKGLYHPNNIIEVFKPADMVYSPFKPVTESHMVPNSWMKDFHKYMSDNTGIISLPPPKPIQPENFLISFFTALASLGLSLIPYIGPLLAISFDLGLEAILNPDTFPKDPLGLSMDIIGGIISTGKDIAEYKKKTMSSQANKSMDEQIIMNIPITAMKEWIELYQEELEVTEQLKGDIVDGKKLIEEGSENSSGEIVEVSDQMKNLVV